MITFEGLTPTAAFLGESVFEMVRTKCCASSLSIVNSDAEVQLALNDFATFVAIARRLKGDFSIFETGHGNGESLERDYDEIAAQC